MKNLTKGDRLPVLTYTFLQDDGITPVDLTGATVTVRIHNIRTNVAQTVTAEVLDPLAGTVRYQWDDDDTLEVGDYVYQWVITESGGRTQTYPAFPNVLEFSIGESVADSMAIAAFRGFIRTLLGDNHPTIQTYQAAQLDDAVRLVVNLGQIPGVTLTTDGASLTPALTPNSTDVTVAKNWARVVLYSAKRFAIVSSGSYSFRTRALSESFGEQQHMVYELLQDVYELDNGEQCSTNDRAFPQFDPFRPGWGAC